MAEKERKAAEGAGAVGRVLRIERASLHDGDGLRTVVFLKGCPLKCLWCSTPESQSGAPELGFRSGQCVGCGRCASACPAGAIAMADGRPVRDFKACALGRNAATDSACQACVRACPENAWVMYGMDMTADQLAAEISKDEIFYFHSGGGVTFSGGEPLNQAAFVAAVLEKCQTHGIHTAMETSLYAPWEQVLLVLPRLNFLFADVKLMDLKRHRAAVGVDNGRILENLRRIDEAPLSLPVRVRIPVIPGINDDRENLLETVKFCDSLGKVGEIELLPYHRLGMETYRNLGRTYSLGETASPSPENMASLAEMMNAAARRVRTRVGG